MYHTKQTFSSNLLWETCNAPLKLRYKFWTSHPKTHFLWIQPREPLQLSVMSLATQASISEFNSQVKRLFVPKPTLEFHPASSTIVSLMQYLMNNKRQADNLSPYNVEVNVWDYLHSIYTFITKVIISWENFSFNWSFISFIWSVNVWDFSVSITVVETVHNFVDILHFKWHWHAHPL
jgi:hypothetical protein